jgi:hypothetical protein
MKPNDRCSCGSGRKYKKCCWRTEQATKKELREREEAIAQQRREEREARRRKGQPEPYFDTASLLSIMALGMMDPYRRRW